MKISYSDWQQLDLSTFRPVLDETISNGDEILSALADDSLASDLTQYSNSSITGYWGDYQFNFKGSNFYGNSPTITSITFTSSVDSFKMTGKMSLSADSETLAGYYTNVQYTNLSTSSSFSFVGKGGEDYFKGTVSYTFSGNKYSYTGDFITDADDLTGMGILSGTVTGFSFEDTQGNKISVENAAIDYANFTTITDSSSNITNLYSSLSFAGNDTITGSSGDDSLDGQSGTDTLIGGTGNDTYIVDLLANGKLQDKITEAKNAGSDTLQVRGDIVGVVTIKLAKNVENLDISLTNSSLLNLTGDSIANTLIGNAANNVIDGGKGADVMIGGAGNDTFILDNIGDVISEAFEEGIDQATIKFTAGNYILGDNIENGFIAHAKAFSLTGNALDNNLTGGNGANTLNGAAGSDSLNGGKGNDALNGGAGNDNLIGGVGADTFVFSLADIGSAGTPSIDVIADFSVKQKDVLDLRDLLSNANEGDLTGLLSFIDIASNGVNTEIRVSSMGGFSQGDYNASVEDAHITLTSVNLLVGTDESTLLQTLISKNQILID